MGRLAVGEVEASVCKRAGGAEDVALRCMLFYDELVLSTFISGSYIPSDIYFFGLGM